MGLMTVSKGRKTRATKKPRGKPMAGAREAACGAGLVDEAPPPVEVVTPIPEPAPERPKPAPPVFSPFERGFDAETNSRYEEIKRGNTYITQLQQMTLTQL